MERNEDANCYVESTRSLVVNAVAERYSTSRHGANRGSAQEVAWVEFEDGAERRPERAKSEPGRRFLLRNRIEYSTFSTRFEAPVGRLNFQDIFGRGNFCVRRH
jgi:hypothetical protein